MTQTLTKLKKPVATHISLVSRGAIGIPFRVIKADKAGRNPMFNLDHIVKRIKGAKEDVPPAVQIVAVATTGRDPEAVTAVLKGFGLETVHVSKSDTEGNVHSIQELTDEADVHTVQVSDTMAVVVKGFNPWAESLIEAGKFSEVVQAQNFFAGIYNASDTLRDVLRDRLFNSDNKVAARASVATVLNEFTDYVLTMVDGLPDVSFKLDKAIEELEAVTKSDNAPETTTEVVEAKPAQVEEEDPTTPEPAPTTETVTEPAAVVETPTTTVETPVTTEVVKAEDNVKAITEAVLSGVQTMMTAELAKIQKQVEAVSTAQAKNATDLQGLSERVTKTDKTLGSTLAVSSTKSDNSQGTGRKSHEDFGPIDTAYGKPE